MIELFMSLDEARKVQNALSGPSVADPELAAIYERLTEMISISERLTVIHHREIILKRLRKP
jgi:hypothetical protein